MFTGKKNSKRDFIRVSFIIFGPSKTRSLTDTLSYLLTDFWRTASSGQSRGLAIFFLGLFRYCKVVV